jgi:co-chaperonin GroES (HSP10)/predicted DNA-binding protein (MmcQ/YjbR family)
MTKREDKAIAELREFGLTYPEAHIKAPWPNHADLAVKDKTFAYLPVEGRPFSISCKLPDSAKEALKLPYCEPTGYGLGKWGWVTASLPQDEIPMDQFKDWIDESYRAQAPKRLLKELDGPDKVRAWRSNSVVGSRDAADAGSGDELGLIYRAARARGLRLCTWIREGALERSRQVLSYHQTHTPMTPKNTKLSKRLKPTAANVLIRRKMTEEKSAGGILMPESERQTKIYCEVLAVGPDVQCTQAGDEIVVSTMAGLQLGEDDMAVIPQKDVLAVVEQAA